MPKLFLLAVLVAFVPIAESSAQDLGNDLYSLVSLHKGLDTPLEKVDQQGEELLKKYTAPEDRGKIYYQLAHVHAQSGMRQPHKVIAYATAAQDYPLERSQKLRLYVYWGDAIRLSDPEKPFAEKRTQAAVLYLKGLKVLSGLNLPEEAPVQKPLVRTKGMSGADFLRRYREYQKRGEEIRRVRELVLHRDVMTRQLADMYSRPPFATEELANQAREVPLDNSAVQRLLAKVETAVTKAKETLPASVLLAAEGNSSIAGDLDSRWDYLLLTIIGVGVIVAGLLVLSYVYQRLPKTMPKAR